jgi:Dolichyl-phosphate-mannose-protein mannosyltransferase
VVGLGRRADRLTLLDGARRHLRRHWVFAALLVLAAVLRAVVFVAYHPALIFPDSVRYIQYAHSFATGHWSVDGLRQSGYSVLIIPVMLLHALWVIPLVQHLAGLATAVLVYAVLVHFGIRAWIAALASVPVLFDPLQLVLEQYALTDIWTVFLIVAALVILVWDAPGRRGEDSRAGAGLTWRRAAWCGLLLGLAVTFRDEELIMIVPAVVHVAVTVRPARRLARRMAALAGCFLIPVAGYLGWFGVSHGEPGFTTFSGAFLYGRVADFASCQGLNLPSYEKPLCPTQPPALRSADFYTWAPQSPQWTFRPPAGMSRDAVVRDFSLRVLRHQPLAYAEAVGRDLGYGFSPVRGAGPEHYPRPYLQFHAYILPDPQADASLAALGYQAPAARPGPAAFLAGYGRWFYVPGPVFAAGLVLAVAGLAVGTHRRSQPKATRDACLMFTLSAVLVLIPPAMFATFDWRYELPQLSLIPVAAVLGAAMLGHGRLTAARTSAGGTPRTRPASAESGLRAPGAR